MVVREKVRDSRVVEKYTRILLSANKRGIEFDLTLKKIRSLLNTRKCFFTGVELTHLPDLDNSLTFDRVDNSVGYIDSNVVACSRKFNFMKANLEVEDIRLLSQGLKKFKLL